MRIIFSTMLVFFLSVPLFAEDDDIVLISSASPGEAIMEKTIERIYLKRKVIWDDGRRIVALNLPVENPLRAIFTKRILKKTHSELVDYWNEQHFKGVSPPLVVESEEAVKRFVKEVPGAIGYIRRKNLEEGLNVIYTIKVQ